MNEFNYKDNLLLVFSQDKVIDRNDEEWEKLWTVT